MGIGNQYAPIMLVGEAPGKQEDLQGVPFVGKAGTMLDRLLKDLEIDRKKLYITNIVKCRPTNENKNRPPSPVEIQTCSKYLRLEIE